MKLPKLNAGQLRKFALATLRDNVRLQRQNAAQKELTKTLKKQLAELQKTVKQLGEKVEQLQRSPPEKNQQAQGPPKKTRKNATTQTSAAKEKKLTKEEKKQQEEDRRKEQREQRRLKEKKRDDDEQRRQWNEKLQQRREKEDGERVDRQERDTHQPPVAGAQNKTPWRDVVGRRRGRKREIGEKPEVSTPKKPAPAKEQLLQRRRPRQPAIILSKKRDDQTYPDILRIAKQRVVPGEFQLQVAKVRSTKKGELLLELRGLSGKDGDVQGFAKRLREALVDDADVKVPQRHTTLIILDIEESASVEDISSATGAVGRVTTQKMRGGGQLAKVQVPIERGLQILRGEPLTIGWSRCRVRSLEKQNNLPRCFKCLQLGHMAKECKNTDLQRPCYRCGKPGHVAAGCVEPPNCPVCKTLEGQKSDHTLGGHGCSSSAHKGQGKGDRRREWRK